MSEGAGQTSDQAKEAHRRAIGLPGIPQEPALTAALSTVDAQGVGLAAIKGLNRKLERRLRTHGKRIRRLERRIEALRGRGGGEDEVRAGGQIAPATLAALA